MVNGALSMVFARLSILLLILMNRRSAMNDLGPG